MRAIRGESEQADDNDDEDELGEHAQGAGGSRRSMHNDCVESVSSFSEGGVYAPSYALSQDTESKAESETSPGGVLSGGGMWGEKFSSSDASITTSETVFFEPISLDEVKLEIAST